MSKPAARITDMHTCPLSSSKTPHVGGPIIAPGVPSVLIGNLPAAVIGDNCTCVGSLDRITEGSSSVLIYGSPAARMGDKTAHGGVIIHGQSNVLIGDNFASPSFNWNNFLDSFQLGLDIIGLIPGLGEIADGMNAIISLGRGDYDGAALSVAAMIPFAGWAAAGAKLGIKAEKAIGIYAKLGEVTIKVADPILPKARKELAEKFYQDTGFSDDAISNHLKGIDFTHPVEVVEIPKGKILTQHQAPESEWIGNYFAEKGTAPSKLGINPNAADKFDINGSVPKVETDYIATEPVKALKSTSSPALDNWSMDIKGPKEKNSFILKGNSYQTQGGATQYFIPRKEIFK